MPEFLSAEWFAFLRSGLPAVDPTLAVRIDYVIGDVRYRVRADAGHLHVEVPPGDGAADLTITVSPGAAAGLASGRVAPRVALRSGEVRVAGNLALLGIAAAALAPVPAGLAHVRSDTTYP